MLFGADRLAADPGLLGAGRPARPIRRLALLTNDAARLAADATRHTRAALLQGGVPIVRLFSPEHGLGATAPDGAAVAGGTDSLTGLPVVSLYGDAMRPSPEALAGIDGVLCDLPDIGARFYTYAWTMTHVVDACASAGLPVWILDRPNPLGGLAEWVEGPLLEPAHASFLGRHTIPIRHSLTLAELASLWRAETRPDADVRVVRCEGWRRDALWPDLGLPFVPTSPAITRFQAALLYPGICLFEATNLSVGRGSPLSFEAVGAPWLQATTLASRLLARRLPGLLPEPDLFTPAIGPHAGQLCQAVRLRVLDARAVRPVAAGIALLAEVAALHRAELRWSSYVTAANPTGAGHLERLAGTGALRAALETMAAPLDTPAIARLTGAPGWAERAGRVALYPAAAPAPGEALPG